MFSHKFFVLPKEKARAKPVDFALPTSIDDMKSFLQDEKKSEPFRAGIAKLVSRLKFWTESRTPKIAFPTMDEFLKKFTYSGADKEMNAYNFILFSDGIELLSQIVDILDSGIFPINADEIIIGLIKELGVCPPGIYTHFRNTLMALQTDLESILLHIREKIAETVALELIAQFPAVVAEGNVIHYASYLMNTVAKQYGLRINKEPLLPMATEALNAIANQYATKMRTIYSVALIVNHICKYLDAENLSRDINKENHVKFFEQQLAIFGKDPQFSTHALFDDAALAEFKFILQSFALIELNYPF